MGTITYKGTLEGESITGTMSNADGEFNMNFTATRTSKDVPSMEPPAAVEKKPADEKQPTAEKPAAAEKPATGAGS